LKKTKKTLYKKNATQFIIWNINVLQFLDEINKDNWRSKVQQRRQGASGEV
jgi:hypothetical protein